MDPTASSTTEDPEALRRRRERKRRLGFLVVAAFLVTGYFLFSARLPKDVTLVFELPPTLRAPGVVIGRGDVVSLDGAMIDEDGQRVASFRIPSPRGLDGPLSAPVGLQIKKGTYTIEVRATGHLGREVPMRGSVEITGSGERRVDLRAAE